MSGVIISQLGEFSFLLAASAIAIAAITQEEAKLLISVTVLSLALSPFWLSTARRLQRIAERRLTTLKLVFDATFVGERLLAKRGARWARRSTTKTLIKARFIKNKMTEKVSNRNIKRIASFDFWPFYFSFRIGLTCMCYIGTYSALLLLLEFVEL